MAPVSANIWSPSEKVPLPLLVHMRRRGEQICNSLFGTFVPLPKISSPLGLAMFSIECYRIQCNTKGRIIFWVFLHSNISSPLLFLYCSRPIVLSERSFLKGELIFQYKYTQKIYISSPLALALNAIVSNVTPKGELIFWVFLHSNISSP